MIPAPHLPRTAISATGTTPHRVITGALDAAARRRIETVVTMGSDCAYPKWAAIPFREGDAGTAIRRRRNLAYGLAKKMLLLQAKPTGPSSASTPSSCCRATPRTRDHFDLEDCHVIPALVRKCVEARDHQAASITVWGSGAAARDYLHVDDAAQGILLAAEHPTALSRSTWAQAAARSAFAIV